MSVKRHCIVIVSRADLEISEGGGDSELTTLIADSAIAG